MKTEKKLEGDGGNDTWKQSLFRVYLRIIFLKVNIRNLHETYFHITQDGDKIFH